MANLNYLVKPVHKALQVLDTLGGRDPAYSTAVGKAVLAHLPREQWRAHLPPRHK